MILEDVMTEVGTALDSIAGLRGYGFPVDKAVPPAAWPMYPQEYEFDLTYGRGMDRLTLPVMVLLGRLPDRATVENLSRYVSGSGSTSVKQVLEAAAYTAFDAVRVMRAEFDVVNLAGTDYVAAILTLDIAGEGAT